MTMRRGDPVAGGTIDTASVRVADGRALDAIAGDARTPVLCVVDELGLEGDALALSARIAGRFGATLHLLSVARSPRALAICGVGVGDLLDARAGTAEALLERAASLIPATVATTGEVQHGDAPGAIVGAIRSMHPTLAVLSADPCGCGARGLKQVLAAAASMSVAVVVA